MSDNQAAVIEKIKKLLALAERGGTEAEAANAANMAAALSMKYGIDIAAVQGAKAPMRGFKEVQVYSTPSFEQWIMNLVGGIAGTHNGKAFFVNYQTEFRYYVLVREELAEAAKLILEYLVQATKRCGTDAIKGKYLDKHGRKEFRQAFRLACSQRLRQRMVDRFKEMMTKDEVAQQSVGRNALVVLNHVEQEMKELAEWMENEGFEFKNTKRTGPSIRSRDGYAAGLQAGGTIGLDPQVNRSGETVKSIAGR